MKKISTLLLGILIAGAALAQIPHDLKKDPVKKIDTGPTVQLSLTDISSVTMSTGEAVNDVVTFGTQWGIIQVQLNGEWFVMLDAPDKPGRHWCNNIPGGTTKNAQNDLPDPVDRK